MIGVKYSTYANAGPTRPNSWKKSLTLSSHWSFVSFTRLSVWTRLDSPARKMARVGGVLDTRTVRYNRTEWIMQKDIIPVSQGSALTLNIWMSLILDNFVRIGVRQWCFGRLGTELVFLPEGEGFQGYSITDTFVARSIRGYCNLFVIRFIVVEHIQHWNIPIFFRADVTWLNSIVSLVCLSCVVCLHRSVKVSKRLCRVCLSYVGVRVCCISNFHWRLDGTP